MTFYYFILLFRNKFISILIITVKPNENYIYRNYIKDD